MGDLDGWKVILCLVCVRRFVCLLVGHPCCVMCVCSAFAFYLSKICVFTAHGGCARSFGHRSHRGAFHLHAGAEARVSSPVAVA